MAVIKCAECGDKVSASAKNCPHCGAVRKKFNKTKITAKEWRNIIGVALALFLVISLGNYFDEDNPARGEARNSEPEVSTNIVCRAAIAHAFGKELSIVKAIATTSNLSEVSYVRPQDNQEWKFRCRVAGNRVIWAGFDNGEWGRWRNEQSDSVLTYAVRDSKLIISEQYPGASRANAEAYNLTDLGINIVTEYRSSDLCKMSLSAVTGQAPGAFQVMSSGADRAGVRNGSDRYLCRFEGHQVFISSYGVRGWTSWMDERNAVVVTYKGEGNLVTISQLDPSTASSTKRTYQVPN